jgi:signal transduction histidine kinase
MVTDSCSLRQVAHVHITGVIPSGLTGRTPDGTRVLVRTREVAWRLPVSLDAYIGQDLLGIVLRRNPIYDEIEMSLRLAEADPWRDATNRYRLEMAVEGVVVGTTEHHAFIELEPGIIALLPREELPVPKAVRVDEVFWIDDRVLAEIARVEPEHRRMTLTLHPLLRQRHRSYRREVWLDEVRADTDPVTIGEMLPESLRLQLLRLVDRMTPTLPCELKVLLVAESQGHSAGLERLLSVNGCLVEYAPTIGAARTLLDDPNADLFDLVVLDWDQPRSIRSALAHMLRHSRQHARLMILYDPLLPILPEEWESLRSTLDPEAIPKVDGEAIREALIVILTELRLRNCSRDRASYSPQVPGEHLLSAATRRLYMTETIDLADPMSHFGGLLQELSRASEAMSTILLRLDTGRQTPVEVAQAGLPFPAGRGGPEILYSPLADVLIRGEEVNTTASREAMRFSRLTALLPFEGFLGIPILLGEGVSHGLFLLKRQGQFQQPQLEMARLSAFSIAAHLEQAHLARTLSIWQTTNLAGQIAGSIVHEVSTRLLDIFYQGEVLKDHLRTLEREPRMASDATFLREMDRALEKIGVARKEGGALREQYLGLMASDKPISLNVAVIADEALQLLRSRGRESGIVIKIKTPKSPVWVTARRSELKQVLLNLILNAIQQMAQIGREGIVEVDVGMVTPQGPAQIRIRDAGPGVHFHLWERIFDFGFTTRRDGSGLGLWISRHIMHELGGRLVVEGSLMLWGTTFLVELPPGGQHV